MATMAELETMLRGAAAAGDKEAARKLWGIIDRAKQDPSNLIPEAQVPGTYPVRPEPTLGEKAIGAGETALATAFGATTGAAGLLIGRLKQLGEELVAGNIGTREAGERIAAEGDRLAREFSFRPRTETGQEYTERLGEAAETLVPLAPLGREIATVAAASRAAVPQAAAGVRRASEAAGITRPPAQVPATQPGFQARAPVQPELGTPAGETPKLPVIGRAKARAEDIRADPYNADFAPYKIEGGVAVTDKAANEALRQGWRPGFVQRVKQMNPESKKLARQQLNIFKIGRKNDKFFDDHLPADIPGKAFQRRVDELFKLKRQAAKRMDAIAESLKGKSVDFAPATDAFVDALRKIRVKVVTDGGPLDRPDFQTQGGRIKVSLRGSRIQGDRASKKLLKDVFDRLSDVEHTDALGLHDAKTWLSDQVKFGKKGPRGLSNTTEQIVKTLRHDINEALRREFPAYKKNNDIYSQSLGALDDIQKAVGTSIDLEGPSTATALGQEARRFITNYRGRTLIKNAVDKAERVLAENGRRYQESIQEQIKFANEIEDMFGAIKPGTFQGKISSAIETGLEKAQRGKRGAAEIGVEMAGKAINKMRGINEQNAVAAMERLLKENAKSQGKALVPTGEQ